MAVGHRLLEVHVLAGEQGRARDRVVQVIGHDDHDAVDVGAIQHGAVVTPAAFRAGLDLRVVHARLPDVADLDELDVALALAPGEEAATEQVLELHAAADEAEADAVVGAEHAARWSGHWLRRTRRVAAPAREAPATVPAVWPRNWRRVVVFVGSLDTRLLLAARTARRRSWEWAYCIVFPAARDIVVHRLAGPALRLCPP